MTHVFPLSDLEAHVLALNAIKDCVSVLDENSTLVLVNDAWVNTIGMSREMVLGKRVQDLPDFNNHASRQEAVNTCLRENRPTTVCGPYRLLNGQVREFSTQCYPYRDSTGKVVGVVRVSQDVTEETQSRSALERAVQQAQVANLSKSRFLSNLSHELRTPLTAILGFAHLLEMDKDQFSQWHQEFLANILDSGRQLQMLIDDLLDHAQIEGHRLKVQMLDVDVHWALAQVINSQAPQAVQREIRLENLSTQCPGPLYVRADPGRLVQVLSNLVSNAIKYNQHGGLVRIEVQALPNTRISISVSDTGAGIDAPGLGRIFEPFERLHHTSGKIRGVGLGLSICKELMALMGGDIQASSKLGQGSRFSITLDAADSASDEAPQAKGTDADTEWEGLSLLYIENDAMNQTLMSHGLSAFPELKLHMAHSTQQGLSFVSEGRFDAVFLDLQLCGAQGAHLLSQIRARSQEKPCSVIAVTTLTDSTADLSDFDLVLSKPWATERLKEIVDYLRRLKRLAHKRHGDPT